MSLNIQSNDVADQRHYSVSLHYNKGHMDAYTAKNKSSSYICGKCMHITAICFDAPLPTC